MNFISKLFKKKEEETEVVSKGSVEEFVTLIRVYYQAVMAVQLGITNLNILNDMAKTSSRKSMPPSKRTARRRTTSNPISSCIRDSTTTCSPCSTT